MKDESTWESPEEVIQIPHTSQRGQSYTIVIEGFSDLLMRGKRDIPMHLSPFRLIRVRWLTETGEAAFKRDIWLVVMGQRRSELSLEEIYHSYRQRYDLEHFFRFGKQRLLLDKFQSPSDQREESFIQIVGLAYVQLFLALKLVTTLPRPWERYLPQSASETATPSQTQRDMERIIGQIGTPAKAPKVCGKSPRRPKGETLDKRRRPPVVKKGKKKRQKSKKLPKAA